MGALAVPAHALELISPAPGAKLEWTTTRPKVAVKPASGETPKWVLVATDAEMKNTIRYCRAWFADAAAMSTFNWACSSYAIGANIYGQDVLQPLTWGATYYWKVVFTNSANQEQSSEVRAFTIAPIPPASNISSLSDRIHAQAIGSTSDELNSGKAAYINSGLRISDIRSRRIRGNLFRIEISYQGGVVRAGSVVEVNGPRGSVLLPVKHFGKGKLKARWRRSVSDNRPGGVRYKYQARLKSLLNGSTVRSPVKRVLIRTKASAHTSALRTVFGPYGYR